VYKPIKIKKIKGLQTGYTILRVACFLKEGIEMKIGIDIGGSHIGVALIGVGGQIKADYEKELEEKDKKEDVLQAQIQHAIQKLLEENEIRKSAITRIGIALPGIIQGNKATNLWNLHIESFHSAFLQKEYPQATITMRNDADAAVLAEKKYGALEPYENALFLCMGTGIGGGYIYQGKLAFENTFEPGHMTIHKEGRKCTCGNTGCFERYASMKQFKQSIIQVLELDKHTSSKELLEILTNTKDNPIVAHTIEQYIENVAIGIGNLCNILSPEAICLGGSFVYYKTLLMPLLERKLKQESYIFNKKNMPQFVTAKLQNKAGMLGSIL